jgi:hypothetical protein
VGAAAALAMTLGVAIAAQQPPGPPGGRGRGAAPPSPQAGAPVDMTGSWVSVITEDWEWRMVTPRKGDYASVPLSPEGRKIADAWDVSRDGACDAYGAAGLMRLPLRLRITWQDANTLKIETDAGQQTRLLRFETPAPAVTAAAAERTLQGVSVADWDRSGGAAIGPFGAGGGVRGGGAGRGGARWAPLRVVTTGLRGGWLRRNGVPYSDATQLTEYFIRFADGPDEWMTVVSRVEDPRYLTQPFITSSQFRREADGSKWKPSPCRP